MKVLVVGGGGREHAIARALASSPGVEVIAAMARKNPGIAALATRTTLVPETRVADVVAFARQEKADYAVIGPEAPLAAGIADRLTGAGIGCMGPSLAAARVETDKAFCREMMDTHGIAGCPHYRIFPDGRDAVSFLKQSHEQYAIKPAGLTGGKGVRIMGEHVDLDGAIRYVTQLGRDIVIEERLVGEEFTLQAFVDGEHLVPMPLVQDHKRAYEGDEGPNTGGMGSYSMPDHRMPFVSPADYDAAIAIMEDTVSALAGNDTPYHGILYGQFMNTRDGPMVIEFNARFGDPEAMNVLPLLTSDFGAIVAAVADGDLRPSMVSFAPKATVCTYLVPEGYPESPQVNAPFAIGDPGEALVFYANVGGEEGGLSTLTSRTLAFVGIGDDLATAGRIAEGAASRATGKVRHRRDIGTPEAVARRVRHMEVLRQ